jgi:hypothetical protein
LDDACGAHDSTSAACQASSSLPVTKFRCLNDFVKDELESIAVKVLHRDRLEDDFQTSCDILRLARRFNFILILAAFEFTLGHLYFFVFARQTLF